MGGKKRVRAKDEKKDEKTRENSLMTCQCTLVCLSVYKFSGKQIFLDQMVTFSTPAQNYKFVLTRSRALKYARLHIVLDNILYREVDHLSISFQNI